MPDTTLRYIETLRHIPRHPRKTSSSDLQRKLADLGYEVNLRTIQRDLEKLSATFPIIADEGSPRGWSWDRQAAVENLPAMDPPTALTFCLAQDYLAHWLPAGFLDHLQPHFNHARQVLDSTTTVRTWPDRVRMLTRHPPLIPPEVDEETARIVYDALYRNLRFDAVYRSRNGKVSEYRVNPLGLIFRDAVTYLAASLFDYDDPVLLALHRFEQCQSTDQPARNIPGFKLDDMVSRGGYEYPHSGQPVKLEVLFNTDAIAHLSETPLAKDQTITDATDGWHRLTATVADNPQLRWWLLGFGDQAEVIAPTALRQEMASTADNLAKTYNARP